MCASLVAIASLLVDPVPLVDKAELSLVESTLGGYFKQLASIELTYTERWQPSPETLDGTAERQQRSRDNAPVQIKQKLIEDQRKSQGMRLTRSIDLLYAYPNVRMCQTELKEFTDASTETREIDMYINNDTRTVVDKTGNQVIIDTPVASIRFPLNAIGLRMPNSANIPLTDLFDHTSVIYNLGQDSFNGHNAVVWRVGPRIPVHGRILGWDDDTTVTLWLAKEMHYLPLKIEISLPKKRFYRLTSDDFQSTQIHHTGLQLPFPRSCTFEDPGGITVWRISGVAINPDISAGSFQARVPPDMFVLEHGKPKRLSGGKQGRAVRVRSTVEEARHLLASVPLNQTESAGWSPWTWHIVAIGIVMSFIVGTLYLRRMS